MPMIPDEAYDENLWSMSLVAAI